MVSPAALQKLLAIFSKVDIVRASFSDPDTDSNNDYLPILPSMILLSLE